jgi:hypothetical protein
MAFFRLLQSSPIGGMAERFLPLRYRRGSEKLAAVTEARASLVFLVEIARTRGYPRSYLAEQRAW